jgi:hypothetical protein
VSDLTRTLQHALTRTLQHAVGIAQEILNHPYVEPSAPRYLVAKALPHLQRALWTVGNPPANYEPMGPSRAWLQRAIQKAGYYIDRDVDAGRMRGEDEVEALREYAGLDPKKPLVEEGTAVISISEPAKVHACRCDMRSLLIAGCKCGGV